jgi:hypothetical protein
LQKKIEKVDDLLKVKSALPEDNVSPGEGMFALIPKAKRKTEVEGLKVLSNTAPEKNDDLSTIRDFAPPTQKIVLLRAIGNALPPRHEPEQALTNLQFVLKNEPNYPGLDKHYVLNRLTDASIEERLISMLDLPYSTSLLTLFIQKSFTTRSSPPKLWDLSKRASPTARVFT